MTANLEQRAREMLAEINSIGSEQRYSPETQHQRKLRAITTALKGQPASSNSEFKTIGANLDQSGRVEMSADDPIAKDLLRAVMKHTTLADPPRYNAPALANEAFLMGKAAGLAASSWLDISSAPKDGTPLDLWVVFPTGGHRWADARWLEAGEHVCSGPANWCSSEKYPLHAFTEQPIATHYMLLPSPPEPATPESEPAQDDETCTTCRGTGYDPIMERRCQCLPAAPELG